MRTTNDFIDNQKKLKSEEYYRERREQRMKEAGLDNLRVTIDKVQIREYPIILGCNPAVSQGPPLEIDWKHQSEKNYEFDKYESGRERRTIIEFKIPAEVRIQILQRQEETMKNINVRSREMKALRVKRLETNQQMYRAKNHERMEKISRGFKNIFSDKKKKEKQLLKKTESLGQLADEVDLEDVNAA